MGQKKKCLVCGKPVLLHGAICSLCQERIRREAMGEKEELRSQAEKELKKYGVVPDEGAVKKKP